MATPFDVAVICLLFDADPDKRASM